MARISRRAQLERANFLNSILRLDVNPTLVVRQFEEAAIAAGKSTMWFWFENLYKEHFRIGAASRYGYQKRNPKYQKWKEKRFKERRPLVLRRRFMRETLAQPRTAPTGRKTMFGYVFRIGLRGPKYISQNRHINLWQEATAKDMRDLNRLFAHMKVQMQILLGLRR